MAVSLLRPVVKSSHVCSVCCLICSELLEGALSPQSIWRFLLPSEFRESGSNCWFRALQWNLFGISHNRPMPSSLQTCQPNTKNSMTREQKCQFFMLLKELLKNTSSLNQGEEVQDQYDGKILRLAFWTKKCKVAVLNSSGKIQFEKIVPTTDIYLRWREGAVEEPLSPENLQRVENELRFLGVRSKETDACFSIAKTKFIQELQCLQINITLKLICDEVIMTFVSGKGENLATILYNSNQDKPVYSINVADWWVRIGRWIWTVLCGIGAMSDALVNTLSAVETWLESLTSLVKSLGPLLRTLDSTMHLVVPQRLKRE